jgi:cell division transport system permease protein
MIANKFLYLLLESIKSILRAIIPSIVSSLTIAVSLVILSVSYYFYENLKLYASEFKDEYKIEVFFANESTINNALDTFNKVLLIDGIEEGAFIDKDAAAKFFKEEFNENVEEIIGMNPLPMSAIYGVSQTHRDYDSMSMIAGKIKTIPNVDDVLFSKEAIIKFDRVIRNLLSFSFILGLFIIVIAVFFVSNTILLIIHSKKDEIKTMQLLGATDLFIKIPYFINGIILGLLGTLSSFIILVCLYNFSFYLIHPYYEMPSVPFNSLLILNFIIGPLFGLIGSSRALSTLVKK